MWFVHRLTASLAFASSVVVFVGRDVRARGGPASRPTAAGFFSRAARIEGAPPLFGCVLVPCPICQMMIVAVWKVWKEAIKKQCFSQNPIFGSQEGLRPGSPGLRAGSRRGYRPMGLPAGLRYCEHRSPGPRFSYFFFEPAPSTCCAARTE